METQRGGPRGPIIEPAARHEPTRVDAILRFFTLKPGEDIRPGEFAMARRPAQEGAYRIEAIKGRTIEDPPVRRRFLIFTQRGPDFEPIEGAKMVLTESDIDDTTIEIGRRREEAKAAKQEQEIPGLLAIREKLLILKATAAMHF